MRGWQPMELATRLQMQPCCVDGAAHSWMVSVAKDDSMLLISRMPTLRVACRTCVQRRFTLTSDAAKLDSSSTHCRTAGVKPLIGTVLYMIAERRAACFWEQRHLQQLYAVLCIMNLSPPRRIHRFVMRCNQQVSDVHIKAKGV